MATAGCMPTSTVSASMIFDRAEISISTPRADVLLMRSDRSSCSVSASWSCMSTWMVTSRKPPICSIGMRSMGSVRLVDGESQPGQGQFQGISQVGLGHHALQVQPQVHDGLGNLWANAADDAVGSHQANRGDGL